MKSLFKKILIVTLLFLFLVQNSSANKPFTIVIDAGHGGHDNGASTKIVKEKDINLAVALLLGKQISANHKDVKVVYTRKTDVFLKLQERADIANKHHADIFISIHSNSARSTKARGTETYVLGLHKTKSNLDVAMRENSVMLLEDDYKTRYQDFNPRSIDSYIMFELMQDRYVDNSLQLAGEIEKQFKRKQRHSRGVRQAGFWVLHKSACPSVLVELGFVTNPPEGRYLKSKKGRQKLANAIYKAFVSYKKRYQNKMQITTNSQNNQSASSFENPKENKLISNQSDLIFSIQLFAVKKKLSKNSRAFKGLQQTDYYREGSYYKYTYGKERKFEDIEELRKQIKSKFPKAFIVAFRGKEKISVRDAQKGGK